MDSIVDSFDNVSLPNGTARKHYALDKGEDTTDIVNSELPTQQHQNRFSIYSGITLD